MNIIRPRVRGSIARAVLAEERNRLGTQSAAARPSVDLARYRDDPVAFAWDICGKRLYRKQREIAEAVARRDHVSVAAAQKLGKALALDTPIPTPHGWTTMGALRVGDQVFDELGIPCFVVAATEVMFGRECLDVVFDDGTVVTCDADHEWVTETSRSRRNEKLGYKREGQTPKTARAIRDSLVARGRGSNHSVRVANPIQCLPVSLPIDPYVLGVWLGDGHSGDGAVTTMDEEVLSQFRARGYEVYERTSGRRGRAQTYAVWSKSGHTLRSELKAVGVLHNKHVPVAYLRASEQQRREVFAGLLDSDGYCDPKGGTVEFCNTNLRLAQTVFELAAGLGLKPSMREGRATLYGKDCGPKYRVTFTPNAPVFRLSRKQHARRPVGAVKQRNRWTEHRMIVDVRPRASVPVKCVQVSSASHQYLCSRAFIPTHNSLLAAILALWYVSTRRNGKARFLSATYAQVRDPLWAELRALYTPDVARRVGGPPTCPLTPQTGLKWADGRFIDGRNPANEDAAGGFSGPELLYLVDEASGVREEMLAAVQGNRVGGFGEGVEAKLLLTGNPLRTSGKFFRSFTTEREYWSAPHGALFQLAAADSPNITGEMSIRGLVTREGVEASLREVGGDERHPWYQARVLGQFPTAGSNNVVSLDLVSDGRDAWDEDARPTGSLTLGVDPARFGDDRFTIAPVRGKHCYRIQSRHNLSEEDGAQWVVDLVTSMRRPGEVVTINVDGHGVGSGVVSALKVLIRRLERDDAKERGRWVITDVRSADPASDPRKFANLRAQMHFGVAAWLQDGGAIPPDASLEAELLAPTYSYDARNKIIVEPKDDVKSRLGRSPDLADALALGVYQGKPAGVTITADQCLGRRSVDSIALG